MAEDFFSRIKQVKNKSDKSDQSGQVNPVPMDPVFESQPRTWTREELEEHIKLQDKILKETMVRQIASDIMQNLCIREDGNLSAGDCARWCVQAAVALIKYSKQAAEDEKSIWSEDDGCNDYLYADGTPFEESENYGHY